LAVFAIELFEGSRNKISDVLPGLFMRKTMNR